MTDLMYRIYEFVTLHHKVTTSQICKELGESRRAVSQAVSQLILKKNWCVENIKGRVWVMDNTASGGEERQVVTITHRNNHKVAVVAKNNPEEGDWEVRTAGESLITLYFDKKYTPIEVRHAYSKLTGIQFINTRNKRYHVKNKKSC